MQSWDEIWRIEKRLDQNKIRFVSFQQFLSKRTVQILIKKALGEKGISGFLVVKGVEFWTATFLNDENSELQNFFRTLNNFIVQSLDSNADNYKATPRNSLKNVAQAPLY